MIPYIIFESNLGCADLRDIRAISINFAFLEMSEPVVHIERYNQIPDFHIQCKDVNQAKRVVRQTTKALKEWREYAETLRNKTYSPIPERKAEIVGTFSQFATYLLVGFYIRRTSWLNKDEYLKWNRDSHTFTIHDEESGSLDWRPEPTDFIATDWVTYCPENKVSATVNHPSDPKSIPIQDYNWAVHQLKSGKKIARINWPQFKYICMFDNEPAKFYDVGHTVPVIWIPSKEEKNASDWIIAE